MSEFKQVVISGAKTVGRAIRRFFLILLAIAIIGAGAYLWWANWTYSEGTRAGYLIKISKKGVVFKTYEGQLNLGGFQSDEQSGVIGNIWEFSVRKKEVYEQLQDLEGKQVKLHYKQKYKSMPWQGDTDYFIYKAEPVK